MICNCKSYNEIENVVKQRLPNVLWIEKLSMERKRIVVNILIFGTMFINAVAYKFG